MATRRRYSRVGRPLSARAVWGRVVRSARKSGLRVDSPPTDQPLIRERNADRALDFLRPTGLEAGRPGSSPSFQEVRDSRDQLRRSPDLAVRVQGSSWYHTIELPGGVVTPGFYDHRRLVPDYGFPDTMAGLRALDVATFDGFWAFEMERRGATVMALDLHSSLEIDMPPAARQLAEKEQLAVPVGTGFTIAAEALGSAVERREGTVYRLDPDDWGTFDYVHVGDLLLHLERPLDALRRIRSVTSGTLHISDTYDPDLPSQSVRYLGGWSDAIWWMPGLDTLCQWIADAGFDDVTVVRTYELDVSTTGAAGFRRAIVKASSSGVDQPGDRA